jgi:hypothetical protein
LEQLAPKHEKIRFRRDEIVRLGDMPSAGGQDRLVPEPKAGFGVVAVMLWILALLLVVACAVPAALFLFGIPGIADERIRVEAEAALSRLAGFDVDAAMGDPHLSIDGSRFLAMQVDDVRISDGREGTSLIEAGSLRFGLRFLPLLSGQVRLGSAGVADARIRLPALPGSAGTNAALDVVTGPDGLIDPGLMMKAVFVAIHRAFDGFDAGSTRTLDFSNVEVILPSNVPGKSLHLETAKIERGTSGSIVFEADATWGGRAFRLTGSADRDGAGQQPVSFTADLSVDRMELERDLVALNDNGRFAVKRLGGAAHVTLSGKEVVGEPGQLRIQARLDDASLEFADGQSMRGGGGIAASFQPQARKIEIERAELSVGRSRFVGHGAIGPAPAEAGKSAHYRYELVSDGSRLAPEGSTEPDLSIVARLAGTYDAQTRRLNANEIRLRTANGQATGTAIVTFAEGRTPGVDLALSVPEMPVSHVKQIWPWFAAHGAHNWANANLFGGVVKNSRLAMSVAPGRIGSGIPFTGEEISGYFEVFGTRFDITGQIPPVRDGIGTISFRGTDADISISSGTVFLPTGRTVAASNGTFVVRRGELPPVIGELYIDIAGSADAVGELASYKPIDAMRHLALAPEDLAGEVSGNVKARIPLQAGVDMADLGWAVKLSYAGLSIAKPFEGQSVSDASGTIEVVPTVAHVKADAKLNGIPAKLDISEPLGGSGEARRRDVSLVLDAKAREAIVPGLDSMVDGPVYVKLKGEGPNRQIVADLKDARVSVPWVGWSKGPGIPAKLALAFNSENGETRISDIELSGESFSLAGSATVAKSGLSRAHFGSVKLNRGDDISVDIRRDGDGYEVTVRGNSFDARSLIKQTLDKDGNGDGSSKQVKVSLDADIAQLSGFQNETLSGVKIAYRGSGSRVLSLKASGTTRSGEQLTVSDGTEAGQRKVSMTSGNAGAVLRFLDIYPHMEGGTITLALASSDDSPLRGQIDARDFTLVDEPRLRSIVASRPAGDSKSLNEAVRGDLDTSRVRFERGFARIEKGKGYLSIADGVLRGPAIGSTFQGSLYDAKGNMAITGTFMPAYGLNRLFGEIPLLGQILGNGRDRGLIGITYKVAGNAKSPQVQVNPISVIAPGIFRSIFEFN